MKNEIYQKIANILNKTVDEENAFNEHTIVGKSLLDLKLDSLDMLKFFMHVEEELDIKLPEEEGAIEQLGFLHIDAIVEYCLENAFQE